MWKDLNIEIIPRLVGLLSHQEYILEIPELLRVLCKVSAMTFFPLIIEAALVTYQSDACLLARLFYELKPLLTSANPADIRLLLLTCVNHSSITQMTLSVESFLFDAIDLSSSSTIQYLVDTHFISFLFNKIYENDEFTCVMFRIIGHLHDSRMFEVPEDTLDDLTNLLSRIEFMEHDADLFFRVISLMLRRCSVRDLMSSPVVSMLVARREKEVAVCLMDVVEVGLKKNHTVFLSHLSDIGVIDVLKRSLEVLEGECESHDKNRNHQLAENMTKRLNRVTSMLDK